MRAAAAPLFLLSLLQEAGASSVWRADELPQGNAATPCVPSGFAPLDRELPGGGWPQSQLIELLLDAPGQGELSLLTPALAHVARLRLSCVWVLPCDSARNGYTAPSEALPYAPALNDYGIDLARSIFVKPAHARETFWALEQSLRAAHLGAVIGWLPAAAMREGDFRALRRLQLLAQRGRAMVFLLRTTRAVATPSPAALRLQLASENNRLQVTLLKRRGRPLLDPVTLQVHPAHWHDQTHATPALDRQTAGKLAELTDAQPALPQSPPTPALSDQ
jgi:hypothetical protein